MKKAKKTIGMLVAVEIGAVLSRYGDRLTDVSETGFDVKRLDSDDYTMYILKSGAGEICSKCHPFYTGRQKLVDTGGRVDRFKKRYGIN